MEGGAGYTPQQVGEMTLDQIFMRITDRKNLRKRDEATRTTSTAPLNATRLADEHGMIKGRAADGTPIRARIGGKSKTQMAYEAQQGK